MSGVLTVLGPVDLSAVELGIRQFLEQLEQLSPDLAKPQGGTGLCLWLAAWAAALAACVIAHRQLRRSVEVPALEMEGMLGSPPEPFFPG